MADLLSFMAMADFPNRVNELRRARGWSQQHLADLVGVSKMQVSGIERGKREFSLTMMRRFADAFGVTIGELLHPDDNPFQLTAEERAMVERMRSAEEGQRQQLQKLADVVIPWQHPSKDADAA